MELDVCVWQPLSKKQDVTLCFLSKKQDVTLCFLTLCFLTLCFLDPVFSVFSTLCFSKGYAARHSIYLATPPSEKWSANLFMTMKN